jgi:hypothetical protein
MLKLMIAMIAACAGCADELSETDTPYFRWDGERVLCGVGVDDDSIPIDELERGMVRARDRGEVLILYAHQPGGTVPRERIEAILVAAERVGLPFVTFPELAESSSAGTAGLSLGFDDAYVEDWYASAELLRRHGAAVTFFVSNYGELTATEKGYLRALADDGHAIEAHGMGHRNAPSYVDEHGLDRYLADEIVPLLAAMRGDGFAPTTFAYPFGDRTPELDAALLEEFTLVRSLDYLDENLINSAPCPR